MEHHGSSNLRRVFLDCLTLEAEINRLYQNISSNYRSMLNKIPEDWRSHLHTLCAQLCSVSYCEKYTFISSFTLLLISLNLSCKLQVILLQPCYIHLLDMWIIKNGPSWNSPSIFCPSIFGSSIYGMPRAKYGLFEIYCQSHFKNCFKTFCDT